MRTRAVLVEVAAAVEVLRCVEKQHASYILQLIEYLKLKKAIGNMSVTKGDLNENSSNEDLWTSRGNVETGIEITGMGKKSTSMYPNGFIQGSCELTQLQPKKRNKSKILLKKTSE